ncbi:hypothetical protein BC830DRAFT_463105 [Chytriomyces sp. MP71]|nr:hypothetical protein BC830DRAFT_463105 [Chytriomyces sp. MP71]
MLGHTEKALGKRPSIPPDVKSSRTVLGLPREVLAIIFQYIRSRRTLEALTQACTTFNLCVTPILYREVKFRSTLSWAQFVQTLLRASNSRPFGKFVQALDLSGSPEEARGTPGTSTATAAHSIRAVIQQPSYSARHQRAEIILVFSNIYSPPPSQPSYELEVRTSSHEYYSIQNRTNGGFDWARAPHNNSNVVGTAAPQYAFYRSPIQTTPIFGNDTHKRDRREQAVRGSIGSSSILALGNQMRPPVSDTIFGMMDSDDVSLNIASIPVAEEVNFEMDMMDAIFAADAALWSNTETVNFANLQPSVTNNPVVNFPEVLRAALSNRLRTIIAEPSRHEVPPNRSVSSSTQTTQIEPDQFVEEEYEDMITVNGIMDATFYTTLTRLEQSPRSSHLPTRTPIVPIKFVSASSLCQIAVACPNLMSLNLARSHVEPDTRILETGDYLSQLMYMPDAELTHVCVSAADALRCVLDACPGLVNLDLTGCAWVDASVVEAVLAERKWGGCSLRGLNLMDCVCLAGGLRKLFVVREAEELRDLVLGSLG